MNAKRPRRSPVSAGAALLCLLVLAAAATRAEIPLDQRRSSYEDMSRDTKAMQDDDTANPAMLSVLDGEALWQAKAGASGKSCADCHGDAKTSMKGVAARYPAFDETTGRPVNLEQRINLSRERHQKTQPLRLESPEMLALSAYIALQSRGDPIDPPRDARLDPFRENGRALFHRRIGQLNLSCAQCHDDHWGKSLAGNIIPQAHPTGYPIYRLEWQSLGSLQRRLRNCMIGVRAEPYAFGDLEYVELELFLMWRARGMPLESPGVRP
ncbi:sulfur oxidation c-type cytochrome SoxA [Pseudorhodoplanes sp.]|uniref:sulfur oxidation c-type cytochrome SoxA n=1 Tax=Pseudorhodoplanes sp. TaxID=1934341 RepID=UPI00391A8B56